MLIQKNSWAVHSHTILLHHSCVIEPRTTPHSKGALVILKDTSTRQHQRASQHYLHKPVTFSWIKDTHWCRATLGWLHANRKITPYFYWINTWASCGSVWTLHTSLSFPFLHEVLAIFTVMMYLTPSTTWKIQRNKHRKYCLLFLQTKFHKHKCSARKVFFSLVFFINECDPFYNILSWNFSFLCYM